MKNLKLLWVAALAVLLLAAGLYWNNRQTSAVTPSAAAMDVVQASKQVLEAIRARDGERLASWVHPSAGLRFSPYAYVDVDSDRKVSSEDVRRFWDDRSVYVWGHADGSGEPISMTPAEYCERYVLDRDYLKAGAVSVGTSRAHGNTADNAAAIYPRATVVEYYIEPQPGQGQAEFDWSALRLVFEKVGERWFVLAIIHDEWTT